MAGVSLALVSEYRKKLDGAIHDEGVTRRRVDRAEGHVETLGKRVDGLEGWAQAFSALGFWGRLRWLLRGW